MSVYKMISIIIWHKLIIISRKYGLRNYLSLIHHDYPKLMYSDIMMNFS